MAMNDGAAMEKNARDVIGLITASQGNDSRELFQAEMFLQEALHIEGKFDEAIRMGKENVQQFSKALGDDSDLTLSAKFMFAQDEAEERDYDAAIEGDLDVYRTTKTISSQAYLAQDALSYAATLECHANRWDAGIAHAEQTMVESGPAATNQPIFLNQARFAEAECLMGRSEAKKSDRGDDLRRAQWLLQKIDLPTMTKAMGLSDFEGSFYVEESRLRLLMGGREQAADFAKRASAFMQKPDADSYEKVQWSKLKAKLGC